VDSQSAGIEVRRAEDRFRTERDGITTFHSFSYGVHYDPANVGFGPIIAINDEQVPPSGGYATHHHADVEIVTWVIEGALAHEDTAGARGVIRPGTLHWLSAGDGVQHAEHNASKTEPLRFIQTMLRSDFDGEPDYRSATVEHTSSPMDFAGKADVDLTVLSGGDSVAVESPALVHVTAGEVRVGTDVLGAGDEARITGGGPYDLSASDSGGALIWQLQG
jgi:redox-sensitive bicupin YhaK (pirin superfamily)